MKLRDILTMALGNLWASKMRTALNLLGVVISAVLLTMTFAGTRGASEGVMNIINASDQTRQFMILAAPNKDAKVPAEAVEVSQTVDPQRRKRLQAALRQKWIGANAKRQRMDQELLEKLRGIKHIKSLVPQGSLNCQMLVVQDDASTTRPSPSAGSLVGVNIDSAEFRNRLIVGELPNKEDPDGILVDEFTAWKLGFHSDQQLESLIGRKLKTEFQLGQHPMASLLQSLGPNASSFDLVELAEFASSVSHLMKQLDATNLNDSEKKLIRQGLRRMAGVNPEKITAPEDLPADVELDRKGNRKLIRETIIRGIVRRPDDEDETFAFLNFGGRTRLASIYSNCSMSEAIHFRRDNFDGFYATTGEVDHVNHLSEVIGQIESLGLATRSAVTIIERLQIEVRKMRLAIGAVALLILLVAAIGISNTMIIAVLERTPEFGIMKSLGASDRQVLSLVLCEGLITGLLGALLALAISVGLADLVSDLCRSYIESKLESKFDQTIFRFTFWDVAIVFVVTAVVLYAGQLDASVAGGATGSRRRDETRIGRRHLLYPTKRPSAVGRTERNEFRQWHYTNVGRCRNSKNSLRPTFCLN